MYQLFDFKEEIDMHISKMVPIIIKDKSESFKKYFYRLPIYQLDAKISKSHNIFKEKYFIYIRSNKVFISKKINKDLFDYVEIVDGIKIVRMLKLKQIFK